MIKISIIGSGNVAQHLIQAFAKSTQVTVVQVLARNRSAIAQLIEASKIISDYKLLVKADLYIIAVSDDAIAAVSEQLPFKNEYVVHTSGSVPLEDLSDNNRKGVFYPLQTFTKGKEVNFRTIPLCLESQFIYDYDLLKRVGNAISDKLYTISSEQRKALHVAAVFVNNFTNHMYSIAGAICEENRISFDIMKPLLQETADKALLLSPEAAQTGPAIRHDQTTIEQHLSFLEAPLQREIYQLITKSIQDNNGTKL